MKFGIISLLLFAGGIGGYVALCYVPHPLRLVPILFVGLIALALTLARL